MKNQNLVYTISHIKSIWARAWIFSQPYWGWGVNYLINFWKKKKKIWLIWRELHTVDSRYLDPSYLDPITYVELISKSRLFSLCIYCISASRMSNYFYVDTSAISSIIFSPWIYFSQFLLPRISNSDHDEGKKNVRCGAAGLSVNENHNRPLINKSIF